MRILIYSLFAFIYLSSITPLSAKKETEFVQFYGRCKVEKDKKYSYIILTEKVHWKNNNLIVVKYDNFYQSLKSMKTYLSKNKSVSIDCEFYVLYRKKTLRFVQKNKKAKTFHFHILRERKTL